MKLIISIFLPLLACCSIVFSAGQPAPSPYRPFEQYGIDAQNTNRTSVVLSITKPEVKWALDLGGYSVKRAALCSDGMLIVTTAKWSGGAPGQGELIGRVFAVNPAGKVVWEHELEPRLEMCPATTSGGIVYMTSGGRLWAFNPDGTKKWEFYRERNWFSAPVLDNDGTIYLGALTGLFAVKPDGKLKWSVMGIQECKNPSLNMRGEIIVHGMSTQGRGLYLIKPDGSSFKLIKSLEMPYINIAVDNQNRCIVTQNYELHCFSQDGQLAWSFKRELVQERGVMRNEPSLTADGAILVKEEFRRLLCMSSTGGQSMGSRCPGLCPPQDSRRR